jgi:hypothetical protein
MCLIIGTEAKATGSLSYQQLGRANSAVNSTAPNFWLNYEYHKEKHHRGGFDSEIDFGFRHIPENDATLISVPSAYVEYSRGHTTSSWGRRKLDWVPTEKYWGLGKVNHQRGFSLMENNEEGLIGVHINRRTKRLDLDLFASYLHVPQMYPGYVIKEGEVKGQNEWSKLPPQRVVYNDGTVPVYYSLEMPEMKDVLLQEAAGMRLGYWWNKEGGAHIFGLYKAEPQARINATGHYEQTTIERAAVKARPFMNHHTILGFNAFQAVGRVRFDLTAMDIKPRVTGDSEMQFENLRYEPVFVQETYGILSATYRGDVAKATLSYINSSEKTLRNVSTGPSFFGAPTRWRNAIGAQASYDITEKIQVEGDVKSDQTTKDRLFAGEASWRAFSAGSVALGMQMLEAPDDNSFWGAFRSNDTFYSRLTFNF